MERLKTDRTYWLACVLAFIPFGWIYTLWFFYDAIKSLNIACGAKEGSDYDNKKSPGLIVFLLFNAITGGIYQLYWIWKQGNRMTTVGEKYGIVSHYLDPERKKFKVIITCIIIDVVLGIIDVVLVILSRFVPSVFFFSYIGIFVVALIQASAYNTFFKDLNSLCAAYNDQVIDGNAPVGGGGNALLVDPPFSNEEPPKRGGVRMISGEYAGGEIRLAPGEKIVIGRNPQECSLVCFSEKVSRVHLEIEYVEVRYTHPRVEHVVPPGVRDGIQRYYLVTDRSTNGTVISNHVKLPPNDPVQLFSGAVLTLGQSEEAVKLL